MFAETVRQPREEYEHWAQLLRFASDPPSALVLSVSWANRDGTVSMVNVWDSPEAVGDFWMERVRPILEVEGEPTEKPVRHGEPLSLYVRPGD